jgi:hypothetical protein
MDRPTHIDDMVPSYEFMLKHFRARPGLYILGAGASAGEAPFGENFMLGPALDYIPGGFPVDIPTHSELSQKIIAIANGLSPADFFPERAIRLGTEEFPVYEMLRRLPDYYARLFMKHKLAAPRFLQRQSDNYRVFRAFYPSMILNYNLDGLATDLCGKYHRVIDAHGTIEHGYGSPQAAKVIEVARGFDLAGLSDDLLLCTPEERYLQLPQRLSWVEKCAPDFIAVIGYSFGRNGDNFDDNVSLEIFQRRFKGFAGNVYVIDPHPETLREMIAERLKSKYVFGVRAYWNVLAHVFIYVLQDKGGRKSINYMCEKIFDTLGCEIAFPWWR